MHLVRLLGAVTTCGLWGDLVGWPLFILLPRAEKKDIYLKLIHHQHVLSFFFFYFNIQMALIARVAEFFFLSKVRHHSQSSHQVEFFGASICSGQRMANTRESRRMSVDSPPPPPVGRKSAPPPPEGGHHDIELCKVRWLPSMWCENDSELEGGSA